MRMRRIKLYVLLNKIEIESWLIKISFGDNTLVLKLLLNIVKRFQMIR